MSSLRELRKNKFLTQEELAAKSGIARHTITRIETGAEFPSTSTLRKLAKALSVKPWEIEVININVLKRDELTKVAKEYIKTLNAFNLKMFKGYNKPIAIEEIEKINNLHNKWNDLISRHRQEK